MIFVIIVACIFAIPAIFFIGVCVASLIKNNRDKKSGRTPTLQSNFVGGTGIMGFVFLLLSLSFLLSAFSPSTNTNREQNNMECKVCGREFQKGSENAKSIRKTNMCTQCYKNYKNASDYLKELPVK